MLQPVPCPEGGWWLQAAATAQTDGDSVGFGPACWGAPAEWGSSARSRKAGKGSAVCAYSMEDVQRSMNGRFKEFKRDCDKWSGVVPADVPEPRPGAVSAVGRGHWETLPSPPHRARAGRAAPQQLQSLFPCSASATA